MNKTEQCVNLYFEGRKLDALRLFHKFRIGIDKEQKETLEMAYQIEMGHDKFYTQIGYNVGEIVNHAYSILDTFARTYKSKKK